MKKYILQLQSGKSEGLYIERFYGASICVTEKITSAGTYSKPIAIKRVSNFSLDCKLIEIK